MRRLKMREPSVALLLLLLLLVSALVPGLVQQASAQSAGSGSSSSGITTFIDLLSSDERFSEFLHTVQRLRMVIPLNRIRNATLLVPTNAAMQRHRKEHGEDTATHVGGAVYRGMSDYQAWYHLIGDGAIGSKELTRGTMVWETLSRLENIGDGGAAMAAQLSAVGNGTDDDGGGGDSGGDSGGDKDRDRDRDKEHVFGIMLKTWISNGERVLANGVAVYGQNYSCTAGSVYLMDGVLDIPPTMQELLRQAVAEDRSARKQGARKQGARKQGARKQGARKQSTEPAAAIFEAADPADTGEFSSIERLLDAAGWAHVLDMSGGGEDALAMHTVWAFSNHAFGEGLNYAERYYLLYGPAFAKDDDELYADAIADTRRFAAGCVSPGPVSIARLGAGTHKISGFQGYGETTLIVEGGPEGASVGRVNDQPIGRADVIARNGIVHTVDKVALPAALTFTPQKMLVGLNATMFVRLLKDTGLGDYIDGTQPARKLTLLVPNNRAMEDAFGYDLGDEDDGLAKSPRDRQREWALYHVADGQSGVAELRRSPLLRTKLAADWTAGNPQVVKALVDRAQVSFNGADNILPEPLVVGNTTIYLLSSPMPTPPGLINALIQDLDLSLFVAAMGASHVVDEIQREHGITVLAPVTGSFTSLGLVWAYLSLPGDSDARTDLSRLVKSHILNRPVYSDEVPLHTDSSAKTLMVQTLNGNNVGLYRTAHGMFAVPDQQSGAVPGALALALALDQARTQGGKYRSLLSVADANTLKISETDLLLRTGVAHVLGQGLILPANVEITSSKLLRGMRAHIFADLLERFNLTYVLEDPRIPADAAAAAAATSIVENATTGHSSRSREIPDSDDGGSDGNGIVGYSLLVPSDKSWRENAAYRELVRRDHDELTVGDDENPWRNSTTGDIVHYLDMLVRLHIMPIIDTSASRPTHGVPESKLMLADRKTYPTLLGNVKLRVYEFANDRFSIQLDNLPFYQSPGGTPFVSFATVVRSGYARSGAVFELDTALRLPPDDESGGPGGWKRFAWNSLVWITGIGMGSGLLGVSGYWVRQWWTRSDYQSL